MSEEEKPEEPKKPLPKKPKVRGRWAINPKTRVEENEKIYERAKEKTEERKSIDDTLNFFGE